MEAGDEVNDLPSTHIPQDIWKVQHISYRVLLPIVIVMGLALSTLSGIVLNRSSQKTNHVNTYFLLLAGVDFVVFVVSIPTATTLNGCELRSYNFALYFIHVLFTMFYVLQMFSLYIILWISYDRFLAIWDFNRFNKIQKPNVMKVRLILTFILCIAMHLKHLFEVEVTCSTKETSSSDAASQSLDEFFCPDGVWIIKDSLHYEYIDRKGAWGKAFWVFRGIMVSGLPVTLVLILNLGIVGGILQRRHQSTSSTARTQRRNMFRLYIILAMSVTFIICTIPSLVHAAFFADNIKNCYGPFSEEIYRALANMLLLVEHISHFIILCFNKLFWDELKAVLSSFFQYMKNRIQGFLLLMRQTLFPKNEETPSDETPTQRTPPLDPSPIIIVEAKSHEKGPPSNTLQVPLQLKASDTPSQQENISPNTLQVPKRSPTSSMVTIEEEIL